MEPDSDSDISVPLVQESDGEAKPDDSDSDVAIAFGSGDAGGELRKRGRRLSKPPTSGSFAGWIVGSSDGMPEHDVRVAVGFAKFRWHVDNLRGELDAPHAAAMDQHGPAARDAWGHLVYEMDNVWRLDDEVALDCDTPTEGSSVARDLLADLERHATVGDVPVKDAVRSRGLSMVAVLVLPPRRGFECYRYGIACQG